MQYEVLEGLPPYGPMYKSVSKDDEPYYSQGFVIRLFRSDGTDWIANFQNGETDCCFVKDFPKQHRLLVIASGQGYIINPDQDKPLETFGTNINETIEANDRGVIVADDLYVYVINEDCKLWQSERVSLDGIKELSISGNIVSGLSCYPNGNSDSWIPFELNLDTHKVIGGSYLKFFGNSVK